MRELLLIGFLLVGLVYNSLAQTTKNKAYICPGDTVSLKAASLYADYYKWYKDGILIQDSKYDFVTITDTGAYAVSAYNIHGCESDLSEEVRVLTKILYTNNDTAQVHVTSKVDISVLKNDYSGCNNFDIQSVRIIREPYQGRLVNKGGGVITYIPATYATGFDKFVYTVSDEIGNVSQPTFVTVTIGNSCGVVYPNPVSNILNVRTENEEAKYVRLSDMNGKILLVENFEPIGHKIDMTGYANGIYILQLLDIHTRTICIFKVFNNHDR